MRGRGHNQRPSALPRRGSRVRISFPALRPGASSELGDALGLSFALVDRECPYGLGAVARELGTTATKVRALILRGPLYGFWSRGKLYVKPRRLAQFKRRRDFAQLIAA
jgi:hypothetical protein